MCGFVNMLLAFYFTGVFMGLITMVIGQQLYGVYVNKVKTDLFWILKISLLSWGTVYLAMILTIESWKRRNESQTKNR